MKSFIKTEEIRFRHCDYAGIVFYPRYFEMLNDLVEDFFAEVLERPFSKIHETNGIPTVQLQTRFSAPARIGDRITKKLNVRKIGSSSVVFKFSFTGAHDQEILSGEATLVNVRLATATEAMKSEPFDTKTIELLNQYV
ncbi:acyl-CoA thioesterase [Flavobacterium sp.]|uniref:acyl-CoA thioesterase n=1 Tax=Flavobacterium sp. TaxID=239 RepID=UPI002609F63B|nr:acyl-CoA thioesterase [Flavobacterium sp.]